LARGFGQGIDMYLKTRDKYHSGENITETSPLWYAAPDSKI
jgi:hypothetical protein